MAVTIVEFLKARLEDQMFVKHDECGRYNDQILPFARYCSKVLQWHENWPTLVEGPLEFEDIKSTEYPNNIAMAISRKMEWLTQEEFRRRFGEEPPTAPLLRDMAMMFSKHPDYNPEWGN